MRALALLAVAGLIACGKDDAPTAPAPPGCLAEGGPLAQGSSRVDITGAHARAFDGGAGGFTAVRAIGFTVLSAYARDAAGRPTSELFVFFATPPQAGQRYALAAVSLAQLNDPTFTPSGPFAIYGEGYDPAVRDYTRWLTRTTGCLQFYGSSRTNSNQPAFMATVSVAGEWEGAAAGTGRLAARLHPPVTELATTAGVARDTLFAQVDSVPGGSASVPDTVATGTIDAFQSLRSDETRLVVGATEPGDDSVQELWLVLNGVPQPGTTIALGEPTLEQAKLGRAPMSFATLRVNAPGNPPQVRELFLSTSGSVTLHEYVLVGPASLCGWARGTFTFRADGTDLASGTSRGTRLVEGSFTTRVTVLQPADSLRDAATFPTALVPMPPATSSRCPY